MNWTDILTTIISGAVAVIVAHIARRQRADERERKARQAEIDERDTLREEGVALQLEMTQAELKLSKVTAKAVLNQETNGDVEEAMQWLRSAEKKYADYTRRLQAAMTKQKG